MLAFRVWMVGQDFNRDPFATPPKNANPIPGTTPRWRNAGDPVRVTVSCHFWVARNGPGADISIVRSELVILDWKAQLSTLGTAVRNHVWRWTGGGGGGGPSVGCDRW